MLLLFTLAVLLPLALATTIVRVKPDGHNLIEAAVSQFTWPSVRTVREAFKQIEQDFSFAICKAGTDRELAEDGTLDNAKWIGGKTPSASVVSRKAEGELEVTYVTVRDASTGNESVLSVCPKSSLDNIISRLGMKGENYDPAKSALLNGDMANSSDPLGINYISSKTPLNLCVAGLHPVSLPYLENNRQKVCKFAMRDRAEIEAVWRACGAVVPVCGADHAPLIGTISAGQLLSSNGLLTSGPVYVPVVCGQSTPVWMSTCKYGTYKELKSAIESFCSDTGLWLAIDKVFVDEASAVPTTLYHTTFDAAAKVIVAMKPTRPPPTTLTAPLRPDTGSAWESLKSMFGSEDGTVDTASIIQYGVLGLFVLMILIAGILHVIFRDRNQPFKVPI